MRQRITAWVRRRDGALASVEIRCPTIPPDSDAARFLFSAVGLVGDGEVLSLSGEPDEEWREKGQQVLFTEA